MSRLLGKSVPLLIVPLLMTATAAPTSAVPSAGTGHPGAVTERVSVSSSERQANTAYDGEAGGFLDAKGRFVVFSSAATNLVSRDTNKVMDVFVRDRKRGTTSRVSVTSKGVQGNGESGFGMAISSNGRYVAFLSNARNLAGRPRSAEERSNLFVRDLRRHTTEQVNVSSSGAPGNYSVSTPVGISSNGRFLVFVSAASNLAPGAADGEQVYLRDRQRRTTIRVSLTPDGRPFPGGVGSFNAAISGNGRYVGFTAADSVWVRDLRRRRTTRIADGGGAQLSRDGRYVAFGACTTVGVPACNIFLRDQRRGTTTVVSVSSDGQLADQGSYVPFLSPDGRYVGFTSDATNLVPGDTNAGRDVFVHDMRTRRTVRVSVGYRGQAERKNPFGEGPSSFGGSLSAHGRYVAYRSDADNLVPGDTNGVADFFVTRVCFPR